MGPSQDGPVTETCMKSFAKYGVLLLAVALLCAGCGDIIPGVKQGIVEANKVSVEAEKVIKDVEAAIATLDPADPARPVLVEKLAKVKEAKAKADAFVVKASGVVAELEAGQVGPEILGVANALPYGGYVTAAIGLVFALVKRKQAASVAADLVNVVKSWEAVGPALTASEKAAVAVIQGPKTSAKVESVKADLAPRADDDPTGSPV